MTTYNRDNEVIFEPEDEKSEFPNQTKVLRPKKYKTKMTAKRKSKVKRTIVKTLILLMIVISALGFGTYKVNEWFNTHTIKWQSPIQTPVWVEERPEATSGHDAIKEAQAKEINFEGADFIHKTEPEVRTSTNTDSTRHLEDAELEQLVAKVHILESSAGKNDGCKTKGLGYNGYGYRQNNREWKCFKSYDEVKGYVKALFAERIPQMGLSTALCYYNTGVKTSNCDYYNNYLKLN